jgi:hypothetical protein
MPKAHRTPSRAMPSASEIITTRPPRTMDRRVERPCGRVGLVAQQTVNALPHEPLLPAPHDGLGAPSAAHNRVRAQTVRRQQDDLCPPDMLLRGCCGWSPPLKKSTIGGGDSDDDALTHGRTALESRES